MFSRFVALLAILPVSIPSHAFEFSYEGMIKIEYLNPDSGVASFGNGYSQVAPTNALRTDIFGGAPATPQQTRFLESAAASFQAAQSRFSLDMNHEKVRTILEFDSGDRDRLTITELSKNTSTDVNYGYQATEGLTVFAPLTHFDTEFGVDFEDFSAVVSRIGLLFRF